jgi:hypothetical protein
VLIISALLLSAISAYAGVSSDEYVQPDKGRWYTVKNDGGGGVDDFESAIAYMVANNMQVRVDGYCASACTLLLAHKDLTICVTSNAVFMFHQPYASKDDEVSFKVTHVVGAEQIWKLQFFKAYPDWVQAAINANGGVPSVYTTGSTQDTFDMDIEKLVRYMNVCK